ncbi:hypothetical protein BHECKSOX2_27 [Bathymodiolus heckerae thiotrophic gill symbiont]|nr:hypothetical protein BHECKSOX2_27 [Bathymodiolus heckerae thiotrophic gill symbiont]SMN16148.1 hypothetical protein CRYPD_890 [uncultured Candidatus Thioglobus sp.]
MASKVINLNTNKSGTTFTITGSADQASFTLSGTTIYVNHERIQSTDNKVHSNGIKGTVRWKL